MKKKKSGVNELDIREQHNMIDGRDDALYLNGT